MAEATKPAAEVKSSAAEQLPSVIPIAADTIQLAIEPRTPDFKQSITQAKLSALMNSPAESLKQLSFADYRDKLTNKALEGVLKRAARQLLSLDLSNCTAITPAILPVISAHCPNLHYFSARNLLWETANIKRWQHLSQLDLSYSPLTSLTLVGLPQLTQLRIAGCKQLRKLVNVKNFSLKPYELPKLQQLDITDCVALEEIQLIPPYPLDRLTLDWVGCRPRILVEWLQFLERGQLKKITDKGKKRTSEELQRQHETMQVLKQCHDTLSQPTGKLTVSSSNSKHLLLLLRWNLPIKHLTIAELNPQIKTEEKNKQKKYDYGRKIALVGNSQAGKSALLIRFADNVYHEQFYITIGLDHKIKTISTDYGSVKLQIYDLAGAERFRTIITPYVKNSDVVILCAEAHSLHEESSWDDLVSYYRFCKHQAGDVPIVLSATRIDQARDCYKEGSYREKLQDFAKKNALPYFECSAKTGEGVTELFLFAADLAFYSHLMKALQHNHHLISIEFPPYMPIHPHQQEAISLILERNRRLDDQRRTEAPVTPHIQPIETARWAFGLKSLRGLHQEKLQDAKAPVSVKSTLLGLGAKRLTTVIATAMASVASRPKEVKTKLAELTPVPKVAWEEPTIPVAMPITSPPLPTLAIPSPKPAAVDIKAAASPTFFPVIDSEKLVHLAQASIPNPEQEIAELKKVLALSLQQGETLLKELTQIKPELNELKQRQLTADKAFGLDPESQQQLQTIKASAKLYAYYTELRKLNHHFAAAHTLASGSVSRSKDNLEALIQVTAQLGSQIPGSGLLTTVLAQGALFAHDIKKRQAIQRLADWAPDTTTGDRLAERFALQLTLAKADEIEALEPALREDAVNSRPTAIRTVGKTLYKEAKQRYQTLQREYEYSPSQLLALADSSQVRQAIMNGKITVSVQITGDDPQKQQLDLMLGVFSLTPQKSANLFIVAPPANQPIIQQSPISSMPISSAQPAFQAEQAIEETKAELAQSPGKQKAGKEKQKANARATVESIAALQAQLEKQQGTPAIAK